MSIFCGGPKHFNLLQDVSFDSGIQKIFVIWMTDERRLALFQPEPFQKWHVRFDKFSQAEK